MTTPPNAASRSSLPVAALLLAAGRGVRFGGDKRQARLGDGRTLLETTLALAREGFDEVWLVLRPEDDPGAWELPADVRLVRCAEAARGMGHSLAAGVAALAGGSAACAVAVMLADMPWIAPASLRALRAQADARHILLPTFHGVRGHPVLFGRAWWPELLQCRGDTGGRPVLAAHPDACRQLDLHDPGVLRDIDRPQDVCRSP